MEKISYCKLHNLYSSPNIIMAIKCRRMRLAYGKWIQNFY